MKIGSLSAAWSAQPLEEVLDFFAGAGLQAIELGAGAYPGNAHCNAAELNKNAKKREALAKAVESRGMVISALSVHGNPLHPNAEIAKEHHEAWREAAKLANSLGVKCINGFSGLPGGAPGDKVPNWVVAPWPEDHLKALEYQWDVAAKYWKAEAKIMEKNDVCFCFEMHPNFLVYNPETLVKLREAAGSDRICANFDPSHLFWQGIDPSAALRWLGEKAKGARSYIQHFHAKDSLVYQWNAKVNGVLDTKHYGDEINRGWIFRTVGYGHDAGVWKDMLSTLRMVGYDGVLSIEHEDSLMSSNEGFLKAIAFLKEAAIFEETGEMTWA
ncbi:MAG: sugar phosphate isomerase/epimerase [Armatimonadetes bacterium]|nr:sugar phosphate isomerase/epimerase [Armatimonadota bacterium]MDI9583126.1 sugar phosphate isomerase/epimerase [Acidobacteriota bacterium]